MGKKGKKVVVGAVCNRDPVRYPEKPERIVSLGQKRASVNPLDGLVLEDAVVESAVPAEKARAGVESAVPAESPALGTAHSTTLTPIYRDDAHGIWLYQGNCLSILDAIYKKYGNEGRFDMIFADPPYFLSNGGITCHAGRMVKVDKGEWDKSRGPELNHEFNTNRKLKAAFA